MEAHKVVRHQEPHIFADSRLTDDNEFVSLMRQPQFTS
jgi:hypothetical protein